MSRPSVAKSLRGRLNVLRYAPRLAPDAHAARVAELVRDVQGELYRSQRAAAALKRALAEDDWLAIFLRSALRPDAGLTGPLASLLLSLLSRQDLAAVLERASIAFLGGRTRADTWPANAVDVLNVLLTNPVYAQHLDPRGGPVGPLPFFVERYENALALGDEMLARLLLQNAPGVFAAVRARDYRNAEGRRFARRALEAEAAREPRSLSLSQSVLASDDDAASEEPDTDEMARVLDDLARSANDDDDDDEPSSSSSVSPLPTSYAAYWQNKHMPENYGYNGYEEMMEEWEAEWEQNMAEEEEKRRQQRRSRSSSSSSSSSTVDAPAVGHARGAVSNCHRRAVGRAAPEQHRDAPTFVHWPDLGASVAAETAFGRTIAVLGGLEFRQQRIEPGYAVPFETHADATQFVRTERGAGVVQFAQPDGSLLERALPMEGAVMIAPGVRHRLVNRSRDEPWHFYVLYTPVVHGLEPGHGR